MKYLIIATFVALSACASQDPLVTESCVKYENTRLACVDDHKGKDGLKEVKADIQDVVDKL